MLHATCLLLAFAAGSAPTPGQTPLTDLGTGLYLGQYEGGLYSNGLNRPPPSHAIAIQNAAAAVTPRDANGVPSSQGLIGFASISMSNATQEWSAFKQHADRDDHRNARVRLVNGAAGGQSLDVIRNPNAPYWTDLAIKVDAAGLTPEQVQVVWLKMADSEPLTLVFPNHAYDAKANAREVLKILKSTYPNLALAYFSSRSYGGYSSEANRSEPLSYETGFATKWLIEDQIAGDRRLNYNPSNGPVVAPVILWGPYLWTNGMTPRSDGMIWLRTDSELDAIHPSPSGEQKIAALLEDFFTAAPSATPWYTTPAEERLVYIEASDDAWVDSSFHTYNFGAETQLLVQANRRISYLKFDLSPLKGNVKHAELVFNTHADVRSTSGVQIRGVTSNSWDENGLHFNNSPPIDGAVFGTMPELSRGSAVSVDVTSHVSSSVGGDVSFALVAGAGSMHIKVLQSTEGGDGPRLVLTMLPHSNDPGVPYCRNEINSTGLPGVLDLSGSASLVLNNLTMRASQLPSGEAAIFYFGFAPERLLFGDGLLCVAKPIAQTSRVLTVDAAGQASLPVNFARLSLLAGQVIYAQCAYHDANGGSAGFNFTNGLLITLYP